MGELNKSFFSECHVLIFSGEEERNVSYRIETLIFSATLSFLDPSVLNDNSKFKENYELTIIVN